MPTEHSIIIYQTQDGATKIDVRFENETLWLSQAQITELFQTTKQNVSLHIKNIFDEGELDKNSTVKEYLTVQKEGKREVSRSVAHYSLDVIIALGYRVKSGRGTQFRQWATAILHEYMQKGFAMNDDFLKNMGGGVYWKELLDRIRDIRTSEKVFYRQVLELYATSLDYDPQSSDTIEFFKIVQNKLHYAASKHTASEIIYSRANSSEPFMGLTVFKGKRPKKSEVTVAKNYMTEQELFALKRIVSAFFDLAELKASKHEPMYMKSWVEILDKFTSDFGEGTLTNSGTISHIEAIEKALTEYDKYKLQLTHELSPVEKAYLESLKNMQKRIVLGHTPSG